MFKDILTVYGKGTRTRQECQDYIADSHRSLVMSMPIFTKIYRYYSMHRVQNDPALAALTPFRYDTEMLIVSPHVTESLEDWIAGMTDPEYLAKVKPDEHYMWQEFVDQRTAAYNVEPATRFTTDTPSNFCAFDFLRGREGVDEKHFREQLNRAAEALAGDSRYRKTVLKRIDNMSIRTPSLYAPAGSEFDAVIETWVSDFESLAGVRDLVRAAYEPFVDGDRSTSILSIEYVAVDSPHSGSTS